MFSMRKPASKFLSLFLVLAMVCSLFGAAFAAEEETATPYVIPDVDGKVVILHTNDTHGADLDEEGTSFGMAGVAQLKKDFEAAGADVLLVSAGDSIMGKPLVSADQGKSAIEFMNAAGYDAMTVGNHELDLPPAVWEQLRQTIAQSGCRLLQNQTISLEMPGSVPLYLAGADLAYGVYRDENRKFRNLQPYTAADLENDLGRRRGCTVLLAHNPLLLDSYAGWGADLVLCGHVHGGLVRLPFLGGVLSPERKFFPKYDKGLYEKDGTKMYVSGGIGKPRLCNPPEINLIHLKSVQK